MRPMTRRTAGVNNVTISMPHGGSVPIVSQTEIDPKRALTEPLPVAKPKSPAPASVCLDVGGPDHLAPFLGFVGDELTEVGG